MHRDRPADPHGRAPGRYNLGMSDVPREADRLLAVAPEEFVEARTQLVRRLRDEGRRNEATAVASIKKPSQVVLAVNRAARDRPQAAKDAAKAAERLGRTQLAGKPEQYAALVQAMETASSLVAEVAVAHVSKDGRPTDAMRRRVADHIRGALAGRETRELLVRGVLTEEVEAPGFAAFAGLPVPKARAGRTKQKRDDERERRSRQKRVQQELTDARKRLAAAEEVVRKATRERDEIAAQLERLDAELDETER